MSTVYDFNCKTLQGEELPLGNFAGKTLLVVNTASKCGLTPQFEGLEELYQKYRDKGLEILGFPCNQFAKQDPGTDSEIGEFCMKNYGVSFTMFSKIDVNGEDADPLYKHLKEAAPGVLGSKGIKWNFTKFLVNNKGEVIKRYSPQTSPADIAEDIEQALQT